MYQSVIFDLDSTLVTIEGIDELARRKNVISQVAAMTTTAMNGTVPFEDVFFKRLEIIQPTLTDIEWLGQYYIRHVTAGAQEVIAALVKKTIDVFVISGGYNPAVNSVSRYLGIPEEHIFANHILFTENGEYAGINKQVPLWRNDGKEQIIAMIKKRYSGRSILIGDSMGDLHAGSLTDRFICFAGIASRPQVIHKSEFVIHEQTLLPILKYL